MLLEFPVLIVTNTCTRMLSRFSGVILLQVTKNQFKLGTYMNLLASVSEHFFWLCQVFIMACGLSVEVHSLLQLPSADLEYMGSTECCCCCC